MPALVRAQVVLPFKSGLPEDVSTNTWHFTADTADFEAVAAALTPILQQFYIDISDRLSIVVDNPQVHVNFYNMLTPPPRVPITNNISIAAGTAGTTGLPNEVSVCLSFRGNPPILPSRRGRLYIGPLVNNVGVIVVASNVPRVAPAMRADLLAAAQALGTSVQAIPGDVNWVIYSPTNLTTVGVTWAWIDDDFDTQRRRQQSTLTRLQGPIAS